MMTGDRYYYETVSGSGIPPMWAPSQPLAKVMGLQNGPRFGRLAEFFAVQIRRYGFSMTGEVQSFTALVAENPRRVEWDQPIKLAGVDQ